ncbi:winged helix DNA-binding protein [Vibrio sp.]|uniref:Transcriptional regulator n=1 Tax=Vibrio viridaestus TaxID=2487322 RepID=A0A3N9TEA9_9VIBR|nr:winged helix DNA-binding protein [Vibrio viridaestus]MDC0612516.1 winged helix DNA-binding protein [Vibrio sp.]RQW62033.1 transcriptional regulator [Vibrio viridaestus]
MTDQITKIVSASHLVSERSAELSEFEFGVTILSNAFDRWMVRCMRAAGVKDMTSLEIQILHHVAHRSTKKRLSDICFVLNIEDTHIVSYALKKLLKLGLVDSEKSGKEVLFKSTKDGINLCKKYREVREQCLIEILVETGIKNESIGDTAQLLRMLAGVYDQAARASASL